MGIPFKAGHWQPTSSLANLQLRGHIFRQIREFFYARGLLEVETPLLSPWGVTDPSLEMFQALPGNLYLQTSPEYAMKRLLAAGSGSIFQICKAFRLGEAGRLHHPEFSILEWYRLDFDHWQLMAEVDALLQHLLNTEAAERHSYRQLFLDKLNFDPHVATVTQLQKTAALYDLGTIQSMNTNDPDSWLDLLMGMVIMPQLGRERPCFITDFLISQAALARLDDQGQHACRFELVYQGVELANGFWELQDAQLQRKRFERDCQIRQQRGQAQIPIDELLLKALAAGLPNCAGVALGLDRLLMLAAGANDMREMMAFPYDIKN